LRGRLWLCDCGKFADLDVVANWLQLGEFQERMLQGVGGCDAVDRVELEA